MRFVTLLILLSTTITAVCQVKSDSVHYFSKRYPENGFFTLPDSLPDGKWLAISDEDTLKIGLCIYYRNGKRNGECIYYWSNGKMQSKCTFQSGCRIGKSESWYKNGVKRSEDIWTIIDTTKNYSQSLLVNYWYEDGTQVVKDGTGEFLSYHPNGTLQIKEHYLNGRQTGEWKWYYSNGKVQYVENFIDGKQDGDYIFYFINGQVRTKGKYLKGKQVGLWQDWYANGQTRQIKNRVDGKLDGEYTEWHKNGVRSCCGIYKMGSEDGLWQYWDENGKLVQEIIYSNGKEISNKEY